MNCLKNLLIKTGAKARARPGVRLQDRVGSREGEILLGRDFNKENNEYRIF